MIFLRLQTVPINDYDLSLYNFRIEVFQISIDKIYISNTPNQLQKGTTLLDSHILDIMYPGRDLCSSPECLHLILFSVLSRRRWNKNNSIKIHSQLNYLDAVQAICLTTESSSNDFSQFFPLYLIIRHSLIVSDVTQ